MTEFHIIQTYDPARGVWAYPREGVAAGKGEQGSLRFHLVHWACALLPLRSWVECSGLFYFWVFH